MNNETKRNFYGVERPSAVSFLEFGSIDITNGTKTTWGFKTDQKAYDWFMLARYGNDLTVFNKLTNDLKNVSLKDLAATYNAEVHHPAEVFWNVQKLAALSLTERRSFFELGQTLFGCIDTMEFCQALAAHHGVAFPELDLRKVSWYGTDISPLFNHLARKLHPDHSVQTAVTIDASWPKPGIFFAKGVTLLYAINSVADLLQLCLNAEGSIFDLSFGIDGPQSQTLGTGKSVTYLGFAEFQRAANNLPAQQVYARQDTLKIDRATGRIYLDLFVAAPSLIERYIETERRMLSALQSTVAAHNADFGPLGNVKPNWVPLAALKL